MELFQKYLIKNKNLKKQLQYGDRKNTDIGDNNGENEFNENKILIKKLNSQKKMIKSLFQKKI